jgi:putative hydrolase of the HAD superfamily
MRYDTIIFDLSGTLINYRGPVTGWEAMERLGFMAVHELLSSNGYRDRVPGIDIFHSAAFGQLRQAWQETLAGKRNLHLRDLLREAMDAQGCTPADSTIDLAVEHYCGAISAGAAPRLGAVELLQTLRAQGRKLGLISNTMWPALYHHQDLARFGLAPYLDVELYSADVAHWKPSPAIFNLALDRLGAVPERAIFVGDNPVDDIVGAHNAGMKAVWILTGEYQLEAGGHADGIIEELPDLLTLLQGWEGA